MAIVDDLLAMKHLLETGHYPIKYVFTDAMTGGIVVQELPGELLVIITNDLYEKVREIFYVEVIKDRKPATPFNPNPSPYVPTNLRMFAFFSNEVDKLDKAYVHYLNNKTEAKLSAADELASYGATGATTLTQEPR